MGLITTLKKIAGGSAFLRIIMRSVRAFVLKLRYRVRGIGVKTDDKLVVFSAYNGRSYACSPRAMYEYMLASGSFDEYRFVWIFNSPEKYGKLCDNRDTVIVASGSRECEKYLNRAKYWIMNFRAPDHWIPKKEQIYVQCWHGTPLKRLGYDIGASDNAMNSVREIRSKYRTDAERFSYLVSSCPFVTEKFTSAWNLKAVGMENAVLETGYPRNDFLKSFSESDCERVKAALGLSGCGKKIILYAPTWRDNQHDAKAGYVYDCPVDFELLREKLADEYVILFRAHYLVADNFDFESFRGFVINVSDYDDINELYVISDMLVTDYSSVFFDYAILKRPMLFYMYDMESYRDEIRGFYLDVSSLPGKIVKTEDELIRGIKNAANDEYDIDGFNAKYNSLNDGSASKRLAGRLF